MPESRSVAIVTGGARRIGRAIVEDLAAHGWSVAIHYNSSKIEAQQLANRIRASGGEAATVQGDLADRDVAARIVEETAARIGKPRLLVNNASMFVSDRLIDLDRRQYERQLTVNLTTPIFLTQAFAATLPDDAEGNVVNMIDQAAWRPTPRHFSYQLAKMALWNATQTMAQSLAPRIRVNAIAPGPTLNHSAQSDEDFAMRVGTILLKRGPALSEFGRTIRYLVENQSITGQMIGLDGGQHLAWETPDVIDTGD